MEPPNQCPRCGQIDKVVVNQLLPLQPDKSFQYFTCPCCEQALIASSTEIFDEDRNPDFAAPFEYGRSLVDVPGSWKRLPTIVPITNDIIRYIRATFVPRSNDIWLATYPKCGTTWIQNVLSHMVYHNDTAGGVQVGLRLTDDVLWMDALCGIHGAEAVLAHINGMPTDKPRMFKSHAPLALLEPNVSKDAKVVHVARNPKDVAVSMWHHSVAKNEPYEGDFQHFLEKLYLTGEAESGSFFDFVLPYCKATERWIENNKSDSPRPFTQVMTVWYERMTIEPLVCVTELAAFLGIPITAEHAYAICDACSFESMKAAEKSFGTLLSTKVLEHDVIDGDKEHASRSHIRKGGIGGWRTYLTQEQSRQVDALLETKIREYDIQDLKIEWG